MADLVAELARFLKPEEVARLAADHRDDGDGRCTGCKLPQSGNQEWPCTLHSISVAAFDVLTGRRAS